MQLGHCGHSRLIYTCISIPYLSINYILVYVYYWFRMYSTLLKLESVGTRSVLFIAREQIFVYTRFTRFVSMMTSLNGIVSRVTGPLCGDFLSQRSVTRSFDIFFDQCLNKRLSKQLRVWWSETPSRPLRRHSNAVLYDFSNIMPYKCSTKSPFFSICVRILRRGALLAKHNKSFSRIMFIKLHTGFMFEY